MGETEREGRDGPLSDAEDFPCRFLDDERALLCSDANVLIPLSNRVCVCGRLTGVSSDVTDDSAGISNTRPLSSFDLRRPLRCKSPLPLLFDDCDEGCGG